MDWINKIHMIIEKMKVQMIARGVDSLEKVFIAISNYDLQNKGYVDKIFFEEFLSKIGIFLKTQVSYFLNFRKLTNCTSICTL